jgi:spermidine/putrescine-binding protein
MKKSIRKKGWAYVVSLVMVVGLTACSRTKEPIPSVKGESRETTSVSEQESPKKNEASKEMVLYTWAEMFPDSILDRFEEEYGIKVNIMTFKSEDEFFENYDLEDPEEYLEYDLATIWDISAQEILEDGELEKIDHNNISNLKHIDKKYYPTFDPNMDYVIPLSMGYTAILVNTDIIKEDVKGYKDFWNPKYKGLISLMKDEALGVALNKLGYSKFDSNMEHLMEAKAALEELKPNIAMFNENNPVGYLLSGQVGIAHVWSGWSLYESIAASNLQIVYPEEQVDIFIDTFVIPRDANHPKEAELFINFINEPKVNYELVSYMMYGTTNVEARRLYSEEEYAVTSIPLEVVERAEFWKPVSDERSDFEYTLIRDMQDWGIDIY